MFKHSEWFKPYVAGYYGVKAGVLNDTKDYYESLEFVPIKFVMDSLDELIALGMIASA